MVLGFGNVGYELCCLVYVVGGYLFILDIDNEKVEWVKIEFGVILIVLLKFMVVEVDILVLCVLGGVVNF